MVKEGNFLLTIDKLSSEIWLQDGCTFVDSGGFKAFWLIWKVLILTTFDRL